MSGSVTYPNYRGLKLDWPRERVLRVTIARGPMNSMDYELHHDLGGIWRLIDADPDVSVVVLTGEGRAFSAGGDFDMVDRIINDHAFRMQMWKDGRQLVDNMLNCGKPIVSAINGAAAGGDGSAGDGAPIANAPVTLIDNAGHSASATTLSM